MMGAIISGPAHFRNNPAQKFITRGSSVVIPCPRFFRLATAAAALKNRALISPAAQGFAKLVAYELRPTLFLPNQRAHRPPGSCTRKKKFQSKPETPKRSSGRPRQWGVSWQQFGGQQWESFPFRNRGPLGTSKMYLSARRRLQASNCKGADSWPPRQAPV